MKPIIFTRNESSLSGIIFIVTGGAIFSIQDVIIKMMSGDYPVHEIVFFRSLFALLPIMVLVRVEGGLKLLLTSQLRFQVMRGVLLLLSYTLYYLSIAMVPLSQAVTVFFCAPLFISVLSVLFLGERIDFRGWCALILGFLGIVIVIRPGIDMLNYGVLLSLLSGLVYAMMAVATRKYGENESGASLVFYPMMIYLAGSALIWVIIGDGKFSGSQGQGLEFLFRGWSLPSTHHLLLMLLVAVIATIGFYCLSQAYRLGTASIVAPFEFFVIPISIFWSFLFWQELPDIIQVTGTSLIIGSSIYGSSRKRVPGKHGGHTGLE